MNLIDRISDLAIAIASDIKGLNAKVGGFDGRLTSAEGDVTTVSNRVAVLEGLHENSGGGLTIEQVDEYLNSQYTLLPWEYKGEGWAKHPLKGTVYCKGVPEGETHKFAGDPIEYVSVYTKEDAKKYGTRAATSNVTDMSGMFKDVYSFNENISAWDVSNVTDMSYMFAGTKLFNQDISKWDVSSVQKMSSMFIYAERFNQDLSKWCVSKISTAPSGIFYMNPMAKDTSKHPKWGTCPRGEDQA